MASKEGKKLREARTKIEAEKLYPSKEACEALLQSATAKFDETVEVAINLGVDPRKADQNVRGSIPLPHGLGKTVRVAVFAAGDKAKDAKDAGADIVGAEDLAEQIKGGFMDFDAVIASPDMMVQVGKIGKILGPRGLMPSPKTGTVTADIGAAVKAVKSGKADFRVDKAGIVHAGVGKASQGVDKIHDNLIEFMQGVSRAKPATSKGVYLQSAVISLTMGPGIKLDVQPFRNN